MESPPAGVKSPKPKKSKQKRAKHKERDKKAQKGADGGVSPTAEQALPSGLLIPGLESPSPAYYQAEGAEPQRAASKGPEGWLTPTSACPQRPAESGISQDKPVSCLSTEEVSSSPRLTPAIDEAMQHHGEKVGSDQLGGKEHAQPTDDSHGAPSNVPGTSYASIGEKKTTQPNEGSAKPSKHHEKARRSKHYKKPGRSSEHRSNAVKETKHEAPTVATPRDQNTPERKGDPVGTVEECHDSNVRHAPEVQSSQPQQEAATVVKGDATFDGVVGSPNQQQCAGTDTSCLPPAVDCEATKSSVIEEPIYYESFMTIANERGSPTAEEIIGGFVPGTDTTLLGFPTYIMDAEKSPRTSSSRTPRNCAII